MTNEGRGYTPALVVHEPGLLLLQAAVRRASLLVLENILQVFAIVLVGIWRDQLARQDGSPLEQLEQLVMCFEEAVPDLTEREVLVAADVFLVEGVDILDRRGSRPSSSA